ncbi:BMP family lipoprotein [Clostridium chauvoei]|nr:BMP family ABC transporter substrate-binding protein [Clostridium chauvoei]MBX7310886.1 BMP family ABC transporter substrate-binding protein [Clostridium chauvoei]MBX7315860.1 BMP family ABC transporter substrate-binding protein [Clostridium chauvoei]MBX7343700.1 BMP family ABC transporter substrate-binding protein [Clostridium chauvoei]MBX7361201.1 BMP family ABC transporter substrate-binding protein [Clostridium chauvoei]MBX7363916.1 BMP family ABC transporter substrate-binding protein [C
MKKRVIALALSALMVTGLVGCGKSEGSGSTEDANLKVGMVTDSGTIDDKSFNEGTWTGVTRAADELKLEKKYLQPSGETHADYIKEITNLYDAGFKFIVTPGFKFETAIFEAQEKYSDAKFILLDGAPKKDDKSDASVAKNTVSIFFAEEQSGFIAGVATALQIKEGELGFIGGMEIPPVQKFNWGFQQGVKYANENLGTKASIKAENVIYQGTFKDIAAGQQIAAQMYNRGVKAIFCSAGATGVGAINEAKSRATKGEEVWVIGVDVDQYTHGIYEGDKSVILTSAMKRIDNAAADMIKAEKEGNFPGGDTIVYDVTNNGVGIPDENPNLSEDTTKTVKEVVEKIKNGEIKVSAEKGDLL